MQARLARAQPVVAKIKSPVDSLTTGLVELITEIIEKFPGSGAALYCGHCGDENPPMWVSHTLCCWLG